MRQIGRELGVVYMLEGSVRKARECQRVTGQLFDASSGAQIWAGRFDGALGDVFGLQDRVTEAVAGAIEPRVQRPEIEHAQRKSTQDLSAYDLFLRGMAIQDVTAEALRQAQDYSPKRLHCPPDYASVCVTNLKTQGALRATVSEIGDGLLWVRRAADCGRGDATSLWTAGITVIYLGMNPEAGIVLLDRACTLSIRTAREHGRVPAQHGTISAILSRRSGITSEPSG